MLRRSITTVVVAVVLAFFRLDVAKARQLAERAFDPARYGAYTRESLFYVLPIAGFLVFVVLDHLVRYYRVGAEGRPELPPGRAWAATALVACTYALGLLGHLPPPLHLLQLLNAPQPRKTGPGAVRHPRRADPRRRRAGAGD